MLSGFNAGSRAQDSPNAWCVYVCVRVFSFNNHMFFPVVYSLTVTSGLFPLPPWLQECFFTLRDYIFLLCILQFQPIFNESRLERSTGHAR